MQQHHVMSVKKLWNSHNGLAGHLKLLNSIRFSQNLDSQKKREINLLTFLFFGWLVFVGVQKLWAYIADALSIAGEILIAK